MKTALTLLFASLLSNVAFANTFVCTHQIGDRTSGVFAVPFLDDSAADLRAPGESKTRKLGCQLSSEEADSESADELVEIAYCDDGIADGGYSLVVKTGGIAGQTVANVIAKNFFGDRLVAQLSCHQTF